MLGDEPSRDCHRLLLLVMDRMLNNGHMRRVLVEPRPLARVTEFFDCARLELLQQIAPKVRQNLTGNIVYNLDAGSSSAGASEMIYAVLAGIQALGVQTRWYTCDLDVGSSDELAGLDTMLQGIADHVVLPTSEDYEAKVADVAEELATRANPGDVIVLHSPLMAGVAPRLKSAGLRVVWRCHAGPDCATASSAAAWEFLRPYLVHVDAIIVTRPQHRPPWPERPKTVIIPPSIDPGAARNANMPADVIVNTLSRASIMWGGDPNLHVEFQRNDGSWGAVRRHHDVLVRGSLLPHDARVITQVGRWDHMKDMRAVVTAFGDYIDQLDNDVHLLLVGPRPSAPEHDSTEVLDEVCHVVDGLAPATQSRVHIAALPTDDADEGAHLINAIQRRSTIVVQKSLAEGFGLAIAEAMWKGKPVVASAVGGLQDQIEDETNGLLVADPSDHSAFMKQICRLLDNTQFASQLGSRAHESVRAHYLGDRHLLQFADLLLDLAPGSTA